MNIHDNCGTDETAVAETEGSRTSPLASTSATPATKNDGLASALGPALHEVYDTVAERALPIYFGPLLGELSLSDMLAGGRHGLKLRFDR